MKREIHPGIVAAAIVAILGMLVGIWVWQPWAPKPLDIPTPTRAERLKFSAEMKASMMGNRQPRHDSAAPQQGLAKP